jgi:hypothetical protein
MIWLGMGETADYKGRWAASLAAWGLPLPISPRPDAKGVAISLAGISASNEPDDENGNPDAWFFKPSTIQGNI